MPKVVFCFAGTGDPGDGYASSIESENNFDSDVIRVYFRGCQHDNVGGGPVFPDLDIVANKIKNAFNKDKTLDLDKLKAEMGDGICRIEGPIKTGPQPISDIGLQGFSRGAVTTFAVAKKLDTFGIPMDIMANQPVPGPGIFSKYNDLTACQNIRSATTLIASHNLENGFAHNHFFHQMVSQFPPQTQARNLLMPHQAHLDWFQHNIVPCHIGKLLIQGGYAKPSSFFDFDDVLKEQYKEKDVYFTPPEFAQKVFAKSECIIQKDPAYLALRKEQALDVLQELKIAPSSLNDEQACAIVVIAKQKQMTSEEQNKLITFILDNNTNAKKLTQIVNRTAEVTDFLSHVTRDDTSEKARFINNHTPDYHKAIFLKSYEYLQKKEPTQEDGKAFCKEIDQAQREFSDKALSIDRGVMRKAMKVITNTILHATGLFLIFNTLNKAITGNYLFFNQTRSEAEVGKISKEAKNLVETVDTYKSRLRSDRGLPDDRDLDSKQGLDQPSI